MNATTLTRCAIHLIDWYTEVSRPLPWRQNADPYRIWISEIMLQQTRVEAVIPYFNRFIAACPDVFSLASIPEERLLKLWEGLGYYSRARNLQKAAKRIVEEFGGTLPPDYEKLLSLPGIGEYTAGAIASMAYDIPVPAVDGNVMRVLARLTGDPTDVVSSSAKKHFMCLVQPMVPKDRPGLFNQAMMEFGETICLPKAAAKCEQCPLADVCAAFASQQVSQLPVRGKKQARRIEERTVAIVCVVGETPRVILHKRPSVGLLANLWELPNVLTGDKATLLPQEIMSQCRHVDDLSDAKHVFSHVEWHMHGRLYQMPHLALPDGYVAVTLRELQQQYALPTAFRHYAELLPQLLQREDI